MGEAILVGGRMGAVEQVIYKWKQYQAVGTNTYYWNRYNVVSTTTYRWNKWNTTNPSYDAWRANISGDDPNKEYDSALKAITGYPVWTSYTYDGTTFYSAGIAQTPGRNVVGYQIFTENKYMRHVVKCVFSQEEGKDDIWPDNTLIMCIRDYNSKVWAESYNRTCNVTLSSNIISKGSTSYGQVTSSSSNAYPSNGVSGSYWYESAGSSTSYYKGSTSYGEISSTNRSAYPDNGKSGSYWYVYSRYTTTWSQGDYIGDRFSTDRDHYPDNGRDGDYWYVFDGEA